MAGQPGASARHVHSVLASGEVRVQISYYHEINGRSTKRLIKTEQDTDGLQREGENELYHPIIRFGNRIQPIIRFGKFLFGLLSHPIINNGLTSKTRIT
jgi:hypothetical protein